ncbi:P-loop containing nucleoside triphosphate hydrolase protein [Cladochytrium replicatum]|nr:P-loop containing nucleoside triphosphate hydrolase protein [Cladochytrium replicatum]
MGSQRAGKHVKVVVRTRPTSDFAQDMVRISEDQKTIQVHVPKNADGGFINNQQEDWHFRFDRVLHNASQEAVYDECAGPIVRGLLDGYNGTILAYGQTGAGKTFTMTGATENYKHRGVVPRVISNLFHEISQRPQLAFVVRVSYLEIYNETMVDLLETLETASGGGGELTVVEDKNGSTHVKGLTVLMANHEEDALSFLFEGETNRSISEHQMNKASSRSHCIFTIYVESRSRIESSEKVMFSKLNLVDLAGSERISKTKTDGLTLREAMYINRSLTFLEQVIIALADKKREHIPFRQSKLTHVLRDALGGNCNTLMISNIWGSRDHIEETISTLRFATRMMCVVTTPELNVHHDPVALLKKYEREIRELKQELSMHDTLASRSHVQYEPLTDTQKGELQKRVRGYLEREEEELEIVNLRQIRETFAAFRSLYKQLECDFEDVSARFGALAAGGAGGGVGGGRTLATGGLQGKPNFDDGVGELDGSGFGVGLCSSRHPPDRSQESQRINERNPPFPSPNPVVTQKTCVPTDDDNDGSGDFEGLPPLPIKTGQRLTGHVPGTGSQNAAHTASPNRADEFEVFKRSKGADMTRILLENKATLRDKKRSAKEIAERVNDIKRQIDDLKARIESKRFERDGNGATSSNNDAMVVIDEEEFGYITRLRELKQTYRDAFEQLRAVRGDIEYCTRLVDQCRQKLMGEFEHWFEGMYGSVPADPLGREDIHNVEDLMDIGEKFDKLQLERMSQEDPDSLPFYNARKATERRTQKVVAKAKRMATQRATATRK